MRVLPAPVAFGAGEFSHQLDWPPLSMIPSVPKARQEGL